MANTTPTPGTMGQPGDPDFLGHLGSFLSSLDSYAMNDSIPAKMGQDAASAFTLPHDVYYGLVDSSSPEYTDRVNKLAELATLGSASAAPPIRDGLGMGIRSQPVSAEERSNLAALLKRYAAPAAGGSAGLTNHLYNQSSPMTQDDYNRYLAAGGS